MELINNISIGIDPSTSSLYFDAVSDDVNIRRHQPQDTSQELIAPCSADRLFPAKEARTRIQFVSKQLRPKLQLTGLFRTAPEIKAKA